MTSTEWPWEEAGANLFTFLLYPPDQWKSIRTTNAIERLHEEFKRRIKTQCLLPCAETACMLFWALLASGQITLRRVDGWDTLHVAPTDEPLDLAAVTTPFLALRDVVHALLADSGEASTTAAVADSSLNESLNASSGLAADASTAMSSLMCSPELSLGPPARRTLNGLCCP